MAIEEAAELDAFFDQDVFAIPATYTTQAGDQSSIAVILDQSQEHREFGSTGVVLPSYMLQIRVDVVADPQEGDTISANGMTFKLRVPTRDFTGNIWLIDCDRIA